MAEPNATPQQALKKAQHDLAVALRGALQALENPAATPGLMGVAMQALQSAQVGWNLAVSRIPLEVMTHGIVVQPERSPEMITVPAGSEWALYIPGQDSPFYVSSGKEEEVPIPLGFSACDVRANKRGTPNGPGESQADKWVPVDGIPPAEVGELLKSTNARKWADAFLAINKNQAVDREKLVGWFANAIETGRSAARFTGSRLDP